MALHRCILHNGQIRNTDSPELFAGQIGLLAGWGVFTTLRISEGAIFAWERHWARLLRDARLLNIPMPPGPGDTERDLLRLIEANGQSNCTMRFVIVRNGGGIWEGPSADNSAIDVIALTADSKKWGDSVKLGVQPNARYSQNEFSGAKILSWGQNLTWAERAARQGLDEVILLNEHGRVAECTSANIFAVFGNAAQTPALAEGCLPGITREVLLEQPQVTEGPLSIDDLYRADEVFITSTTRDLLPVREIAGRELNRQSAVRERLSAAFRNYFERDISHRKSAGITV